MAEARPSADHAPKRRTTWVVAVAGTVVVAAAAVAVGLQLTSDDDTAAPTPTVSTTTSPAPEPTETATGSTPAPSTLRGTPTAAWTVTGSSYGADGTEVRLAAPNPVGTTNVAGTVVVLATPEDAAVVLGVDGETGAEVWRHDLGAGIEAEPGCSVVDDGSTVGCWVGADDGTFTLSMLDTETGEVEQTVVLASEPTYVLSDRAGTVVASVVDGAIVMDAFDPDLAPVWSTSTDAGLVPAADSSGVMTAATGRVGVFVSGASALFDRTSGELLTTSSTSALLLLPGGLVRDVSMVDGTTTLTDLTGRVLASGVGGAWDVPGRLGPLDERPAAVGIGNQAVDPETGEPTWTLDGDPAEIRATVVGRLAVVTNPTTGAPLSAVDATTGEQVWTSTATSGAVEEHDGVVVVEDETSVVGIDPTDGAILWTLTHTPALYPTSFPGAEYQVVGSTLVTSTEAGDITGYTFAP